jgi:hypothetical protein
VLNSPIRTQIRRTKEEAEALRSQFVISRSNFEVAICPVSIQLNALVDRYSKESLEETRVKEVEEIWAAESEERIDAVD